MNYYNENDPKAAAWLRELIAGGHIAAGVVDERSIEDVLPRELAAFTQCHFFAGIGGWSLALRLAGWPDDRPVWTGSCPCQPFSTAGKGGGFADERHLWPAWHHLIAVRRPGVVFGEQVASKDGLAWLDLVQDDMEATGYAFAPVDLCAAGVGAPHIRQRLWFVANRNDAGLEGRLRDGLRRAGERAAGAGGLVGVVADAAGAGRRPERANSDTADCAGALCPGETELGRRDPTCGAGPLHGHWRAADWLGCRDGKWRPVEPGTFPLANGIPARVVRLRGYGNAIVPQAAAEVIRAYSVL